MGIMDLLDPAERIGRAEQWAECIVDRLDTIAEAVSSADFIERRVRTFNDLPANQPVTIGVVPPGQTWALETIAGMPSGVGGAPAIEVRAAGRAVAAFQFSAWDTKGGNGLVIEEGQAIELVATVGCPVMCQFKARQPKAKVTQPADPRGYDDDDVRTDDDGIDTEG